MARYRPRNDEGWHSHLSAREIRQKVSRAIWMSYFKFAFERNPWDRTVSNYWFRRWGRGDEAKKMLDIMREDPVSIFPQWLKRTRLVSNYQMYTNQHKEIIVNRIGLYEKLHEDFAHICNRIGLRDVQELPLTKAGYREDKRHYSEYYQGNQELIDIVAAAYDWEIKTFGFKFENPYTPT